MFDGHSFMQTTGPLNLTPYSKIRISWSQKFSGVGSGQIIWEHSPNYNGSSGAFCCVAQDSQFGIGRSSACLRTSNDYNIDSFEIMNDVWEDFAVEYRRVADKNKAMLYRFDMVLVFRDGQRIGTDTNFEDLTPPQSFLNAPFFIGARNGNEKPEHGFRGQIRNLRIEGEPAAGAQAPSGKTNTNN
jgi:hypothetical protein